MGWEGIKGQDNVISLLHRAIERGRLPHAYLFAGPDGVGKKLTALRLAAALNCLEPSAAPCGHCSSCQRISSRQHPDVVLIEPEESGNIKIEEVRRLQEVITYKPFEGAYKIWIIDHAQGMTHQAANCLLKTLEEPPDHSLLILLSSQTSALLPTVISRCQQVNFARLTPLVLREILNKQGLPEEELELAVTLADGSLDGLDQAQLEEFRNLREQVLVYLEEPGLFCKTFALGDKLGKDKKQVEQLLQLLNLWCRDLMLVKLGLSADLLVNRDKYTQLTQQSEKLEPAVIQNVLGQIQESFLALNYNANPRLVLENVLLELGGEK